MRSLPTRPVARLSIVAALSLIASSTAAAPGRFLSTPKAEMAVHQGAILSLAFTLDGRHLVSGGEDGRAVVFDTERRRAVTLVRTDHDAVRDVAIAPGGRSFATAGDDGRVRVWDLVSGKPLRTLKAHGDPIRSVSFSLSGELLATASEDELVKIWDVESGLLQHALEGHEEAVLSASFMPSGFTLVSASEDKTMRVWDLASGRETRSLMESAARYGELQGTRVGPDGRVTATAIQEVRRAGRRGMRRGAGIVETDFVQIRDGATGQDMGRLEGHLERITDLAFSPDGRFLATTSEDHSLKIWDLEKMAEVSSIELPDRLSAVAFSPDGRWLAAGGATKLVYLYELRGVYSTPMMVAGSGRYNPPPVDMPPWSGDPLPVALLGLAAQGGFGPDVAVVLGDTVRSTLVRSRRFRLIDRANTKRIVQEQRFQLSGAVAPESAVAIGRLLGARSLVVGNVSRLGDAMAVSLSLTDVESGEIRATVQEQCRCAEEDLFLVATTAARRLLAAVR